MDDHPVVLFTNQLAARSDLDHAAAGEFVSEVFRAGVAQGERQMAMTLAGKDLRIHQLEQQLARLSGGGGGS